MQGTLSRTAFALAAITACLVGGALAQQPRQPMQRHGFWFSGGLGYGSLGCQDCSGRTGALSGNISLGGTLSPKLLLGVSTNGWTKSDSGATLTVAALTAAVRFYPSPVGGFFLTGGLGLGTVSDGVSGLCSASQTGAAFPFLFDRQMNKDTRHNLADWIQDVIGLDDAFTVVADANQNNQQFTFTY